MIAASTNSAAVAVVRAAHREFAHQRRAGARRGFVGGFGDAPVERRIAGQLVEVLADAASPATTPNMRSKAGLVMRMMPPLSDSTTPSCITSTASAWLRSTSSLALRSVMSCTTPMKRLTLPSARRSRLIGEVHPARVAAQRLQRQFHLGAFAPAQALPALDRAGVVGRKEACRQPRRLSSSKLAAEKFRPARTGPDDLRFAVFIDGGLVDESRGELRDGAIAELAFAQRVGGLLAFGDVDGDAHQARELAGRRIGDRPVLHFDPAQHAVGAPDLHGELDGFAARDNAACAPGFAACQPSPTRKLCQPRRRYSSSVQP